MVYEEEDVFGNEEDDADDEEELEDE